MTPIGIEAGKPVFPLVTSVDVNREYIRLGDSRGEGIKKVAEVGGRVTEAVECFVDLAAKVNDWQIGGHTSWEAERTTLWRPRVGGIVTVITGCVDDEKYYLPVVGITEKGERGGRNAGVILPDGHVHRVKLSSGGGLIEVVSLPDSQNCCYPLVPGIEKVDLCFNQSSVMIGQEVGIGRRLVSFSVSQIETVLWDIPPVGFSSVNLFEKMVNLRVEKLNNWQKKLRETLAGTDYL